MKSVYLSFRFSMLLSGEDKNSLIVTIRFSCSLSVSEEIPLLEINPRFTFGHLALELDKHIHKQSTGFWMFLKNPNLSKELALKILKKHPTQILQGKIQSGAFFTSDPIHSKMVHSFVRVIPKDRL